MLCCSHATIARRAARARADGSPAVKPCAVCQSLHCQTARARVLRGEMTASDPHYVAAPRRVLVLQGHRASRPTLVLEYVRALQAHRWDQPTCRLWARTPLMIALLLNCFHCRRSRAYPAAWPSPHSALGQYASIGPWGWEDQAPRRATLSSPAITKKNRFAAAFGGGGVNRDQSRVNSPRSGL